jgi:hypothetical protein
MKKIKLYNTTNIAGNKINEDLSIITQNLKTIEKFLSNKYFFF